MKYDSRLRRPQTGMPTAHSAALWTDNPTFRKDYPSHRSPVCSQHLTKRPTHFQDAHSELHTSTHLSKPNRKKNQQLTGLEEEEEEELVEEEGSHRANIYTHNHSFTLIGIVWYPVIFHCTQSTLCCTLTAFPPHHFR